MISVFIMELQSQRFKKRGGMLEMTSENALLHRQRGEAYIEEYKNTEALKEFDEAAKTEPENADLHGLRARVLANSKNHVYYRIRAEFYRSTGNYIIAAADYIRAWHYSL